MARFDWYQGTIAPDAEDVSVLLGLFVSRAKQYFQGSTESQIRGINGYTKGYAISIDERDMVRFYYEGNKGLHFVSTGSAAAEFARLIRTDMADGMGFMHQVSRVDSCIDVDKEGEFDRVTGILLNYAEKKGIKIDQQGDWHTKTARTLYLGSKSSQIRLVIYEKGYEQQGDSTEHPNWIRLEARLRPSKRDFKQKASDTTPDQVFASGWLTEAMSAIGMEPDSHQNEISRKVRSTQASGEYWLVKQYSKVLRNLIEQTGSAENMGVYLGQLLGAIDTQPPSE